MAVQAMAAKAGGKKGQPGIATQLLVVLVITAILGAGLLVVFRATGVVDIDFGAVLARARGLIWGPEREAGGAPSPDEGEWQRLTDQAALAAQQGEQIASLEAELAEKEELIKILQAELDQLKKAAAARPSAAEHVVELYGEMNSADAARILEKLDESLVTDVLCRLEARQAARILSEMEVGKAARIVKRMAK